MSKDVCNDVNEEECRIITEPQCEEIKNNECKDDLVTKLENQCVTVQEEQVEHDLWIFTQNKLINSLLVYQHHQRGLCEATEDCGGETMF